jgi:hypothetical protein
VLSFVLALIAAARVFFQSRFDTAVEVLASMRSTKLVETRVAQAARGSSAERRRPDFDNRALLRTADHRANPDRRILKRESPNSRYVGQPSEH